MKRYYSLSVITSSGGSITKMLRLVESMILFLALCVLLSSCKRNCNCAEVPQKLAVSQLSDNGLTLKWNPVEDVNNYAVSIEDMSTGIPLYYETRSNILNVSVPFPTNKLYKARVQTDCSKATYCKEQDKSDYSIPAYFMTENPSLGCGVPPKLDVFSINNQVVKLSFYKDIVPNDYAYHLFVMDANSIVLDSVFYNKQEFDFNLALPTGDYSAYFTFEDSITNTVCPSNSVAFRVSATCCGTVVIIDDIDYYTGSNNTVSDCNQCTTLQEEYSTDEAGKLSLKLNAPYCKGNNYIILLQALDNGCNVNAKGYWYSAKMPVLLARKKGAIQFYVELTGLCANEKYKVVGVPWNEPTCTR